MVIQNISVSFSELFPNFIPRPPLPRKVGGGHDPPAPMEAPPLQVIWNYRVSAVCRLSICVNDFHIGVCEGVCVSVRSRGRIQRRRQLTRASSTSFNNEDVDLTSQKCHSSHVVSHVINPCHCLSSMSESSNYRRTLRRYVQFSSVQFSRTFCRRRRTLCRQSQRRRLTVDGRVLSVANTGKGASSVHAWKRVTSCLMIAAMPADRFMLSVLDRKTLMADGRPSTWNHQNAAERRRWRPSIIANPSVVCLSSVYRLWRWCSLLTELNFPAIFLHLLLIA